MICKLCKQEKELVKSHIIPKFFFKYLYPEEKIKGKALWLVDGSRGIKSKSWIGPYERLLCKECDGMLGCYDNYAKRLFIDQEPIFYPRTDQALLLPNVDYKKVKLFFLSLLWRASVSSLPIFSKINIGPYEEKLREIVLGSNSKNREDFPILFAKYDAGKLGQIANKNIQDPISQRIEGINFCLFFLPNGYQIFIKVDKRNLPEPFEKITLKNDGKMIILCRGEYEKSDSFKALLNTMNCLRL